jgi:hypothetical protein
MRGALGFTALCLLAAADPQTSWAGEAAPAPCFDAEVLQQVREQFAIYGPRSDRSEYFGFIYRMNGRIDSAITHGGDCLGEFDCTVNSAFALARLPRGAKVLGEWHSHPRIGSNDLSPDDVRLANANRHIRCYAAFYSAPDGSIWRWNVEESSVAEAMASRILVGNFRTHAP